MLHAMHDAFEWIRRWMDVYEQGRGYYVLPLVGVALVTGHWLLSRAELFREIRPAALRAARGALLVALCVSALFSVAVYNNFFNYHYGGFLNAYEFFHYYLGSKYAHEVGYFDMYGAALAADRESGRIYWPADGAMTDLETSRPVPVERVEAQEARYRERFSPRRWQEWVDDVFWFKQRMGSLAWNRILHDRGYNATPVWTAVVGSAFSNRVPTSSERGMTALALLDVVLLAAAVAAVGWTFGAWPALLMVVFLASSYLMAHVHMKGAFLRTDFVVCLVLAVCAQRRDRPALAGALLGYSTLSRLFPAAFLFGPVVKTLWELPRVDRRRLRFFTGFTLTMAVLFVFSVAYAGGFEVWSDFARKLASHRAAYHPWNVGLPSVVAADFSGGHVRLPDGAVQQHVVWIRLIQLAALGLCAWAVRGLDEHRALAFGFVPTFFLVAPTYYYYIVLLVPFLFLAERLRSVPGALGVAYLFLFGLAGHALYQRWEQLFPTYYWNSVMALVLALYVLGVAWAESRRERQRGLSPRSAS